MNLFSIIFQVYKFVIWNFQDLLLMESMHLALETIVNAIFDGSAEFSGVISEMQVASHSILEGCSVSSLLNIST